MYQDTSPRTLRRRATRNKEAEATKAKTTRTMGTQRVKLLLKTSTLLVLNRVVSQKMELKTPRILQPLRNCSVRKCTKTHHK